MIASFLLLLAIPMTAVTPAAAAPSSGPRQVEVGIYLNDVGEFQLATGTFTADFYMWMRWEGNWTAGNDNSTVSQLIIQAQASPTGSISALQGYAFPSHFEFENGDEVTPTLIAAQPHYNGTDYNLLEYRVLGTFHNQVHLENYPLDKQTLSIEMEDSFYANTSLVYVPDAGSAIDPALIASGVIPGFTFIGNSFQTSVVNHLYDTTFGYQVIPGGNTTSSYSRYVASFSVQRPFSTSVTTLFLPISMIVALAVVSFFVDAEKFEERLALLVTSLLATVVLQVTFSTSIPSTGQFTLADRTMVVVYGVLLSAMAITVAQKALQQSGHSRTVVWLDRIALTVLPVGAGLLVVWMVTSICATTVCTF